ncbi:ubiquitin-conjugating enzyme/RWD-like protein [Mycena rebaudengoi]|nr:ubiquitin-conjugating enzyme/RWD-like protein [Mycena rebaudengoi]
MPVVDLRQWEAHIPGPAGTPWEGGVYSLTIKFKPGSPDLLPKFRFLVPLFHPNVYPSGNWAYTALDHDIIKGRANRATAWKCTFEEDPTRLMKLLQNIQRGLHEHDMNHPSQSDAYTMAKNDPKEYDAKIRAEAEDWKPDPQTGLAGRRIHRH